MWVFFVDFLNFIILVMYWWTFIGFLFVNKVCILTYMHIIRLTYNADVILLFHILMLEKWGLIIYDELKPVDIHVYIYSKLNFF